ncbi:MAG: aminoglycoside phosphotransferase [Thermus sp.]|uniref:phosphotransferase family protein n=1 Tax=Thermus sp. TaxID=275 RepID=UPI00332D44AE
MSLAGLLASLEPLGGFEARVYAARDRVYKVYAPEEKHLAWLEAKNLARAGHGGMVLGVQEVEDHGLLVLKRFFGRPFSREAFTPALLGAISAYFQALHRLPEPGRVAEEALLARMDQFLEVLSDLPEARGLLLALAKEVKRVAGLEKAFCHRDPWAGNLLVQRTMSGDPIFLVDWARAGGDDPARDLAILKTGSLDLLGEASDEALARIVRSYPKAQEVWTRLRFWVPLTYLHDLVWFRTKAKQGFSEAVSEKLPLALRFFHTPPGLW